MKSPSSKRRGFHILYIFIRCHPFNPLDPCSIIFYPPHPYYWNVLSSVHWKMGDLGGAMQALEEAMDLQPSNVYFRNQMKKLKKDMAESH
jgi:hypothetical protein